MSYQIGSLNMRKERIELKESKKKSDSERDFFGFIHDLVADENLDVLILQEVLNDREAKRISEKALSPLQNWKYGYERSAAGPSGDYGLAFFWNENRITECSKSCQPQVFSGYKSDIRMSRDPLYGRFSPKLSFASEIFQEYRFLNIHLRFSDEVLPDLSTIPGIEKRKMECNLVTGEIYRKVDVPRGNFKPFFTIVAGDYNLSVEECNAHSGNPDVVTFQNEATTIKKEPYGTYVSSYDHISLNTAKYTSERYSVSRIDAVHKYFSDDYGRYFDLISDHVPIKIEIL